MGGLGLLVILLGFCGFIYGFLNIPNAGEWLSASLIRAILLHLGSAGGGGLLIGSASRRRSTASKEWKRMVKFKSPFEAMKLPACTSFDPC